MTVVMIVSTRSLIRGLGRIQYERELALPRLKAIVRHYRILREDSSSRDQAAKAT